MTADYRSRFYERYASTQTVPRKGTLTLQRARRLARTWRAHFSRWLPPDRRARILDVGSGDGALLWWLQQIGYINAAGVEVSGEQTAIAASLGVRNLSNDPLERFLAKQTENWDVVVLRNVLEHFTKTEILAILELVHNALRPGGRVIIQVPNGQSPFAGRIRYGDFTHELAFTEASISQVLHVAGFTAVHCRPVRPIFLGPLAPFRTIAWCIVQFVYRMMLAAEVAAWPRVVTVDLLATAVRSE
ncbi:MAG TPA: class I SAM-dependent methyltransferase [Gemmatimonadaceae bacterium]|nr:class I SAM-dependent methyltransferase [Gemmatimonadaceae bacterium]